MTNHNLPPQEPSPEGYAQGSIDPAILADMLQERKPFSVDDLRTPAMQAATYYRSRYAIA